GRRRARARLARVAHARGNAQRAATRGASRGGGADRRPRLRAGRARSRGRAPVSAAAVLPSSGAPAVTPACRVERVRLFRFRNYLDETVPLGPGLNVICGQNAQGKTNLLEAVATLALTRSPRASTLGELVTWNEPAGRVDAVVRRGGAL